MTAIEIAAIVVAAIAVWIILSALFYAKIFKRVYSFLISFFAIIILSPLFIILIITGAVFLKGNPFFTQIRPGKNKKLFRIIKFRTMRNDTDASGNPLSDEQRLTGYGKFLRKTSLDELPQLFCIFTGKMSFIGPRPLLVRDMVFMDETQSKRHDIRGGLTGLAQVSGRNAIDWEKKLAFDVEYAKRITFWGDIKIIFRTIKEVITFNGINEEGMATAEDFGDYLLRNGKVEKDEYDKKQQIAREILASEKWKNTAF